VLAPYQDRDQNRVLLAVTTMLEGFPSIRFKDDAQVVGRVDSLRLMLADFPAWAIEKACAQIRTCGVYRNGRFDTQWPPSDAELIEAVKQSRRFYGDQHDSAVALLAAEVEED
jgi:hypothetical protein